MTQLMRREKYQNLAKNEGITIIRDRVAELKKELCKIQSIVDSDDMKMCVDALTGKPVLILREEAQKRFEALFYYVQSLKAINEIEILLDSIDAGDSLGSPIEDNHRLTTSQS